MCEHDNPDLIDALREQVRWRRVDEMEGDGAVICGLHRYEYWERMTDEVVVDAMELTARDGCIPRRVRVEFDEQDTVLIFELAHAADLRRATYRVTDETSL